jgi:hypothetical protein
LPAGGNCPPLAEEWMGLFDPPLRLGLPPACVRAPAKDCDLASVLDAAAAVGEFADCLSGAASLLGGAKETGGAAFMQLKLQAACQA